MNFSRLAAAVVSCFFCCLIAFAGNAIAVPITTSASLTLHLDASNVNNDGGATNPGNGNDLASWTDLVSGSTIVPGPNAPQWLSTGGIGGRSTARFESSNTELLFNNGLSPIARTIFYVGTMESDGTAYTTIIANASNAKGIRQDAELAAYFPGNAGDFHTGGDFYVNGDSQFTIPGGFGAGHIVESVATTTAAYGGFRLSENSFARYINGDVSEVLIFDGVLNFEDRNRVGFFLANKYAVASSYLAIPEPSTILLLGMGLISLVSRRNRRNRQ